MSDKFEELEWMQIFDPTHIPKYLIDQIKEKDFTAERFYEYQKMVCVEKVEEKFVINPFNLLFAITNQRRSVVGFLWCVIDVLNGYLIINNFSIDRRYWNKGKAVEFLRRKVEDLLNKSKLKKVFWCTTHTKYMEKYGFKKSKSILMEFEVGEKYGSNSDGNSGSASGSSGVDDSGAKELPESDS